MGRYAVLAVLVFTGLARAQDPIETVRAFRIENESRILREFVEFLEIPNVSSDAPNIRRNAEYIRKALGKRGIKAELFEIEGASPVVFGEIKTPGATRTFGIYVHYDGQPVDIARWTNPPFKPALYTAAIENGGVRRPMPKPGEPADPEWRLYARASGDDKAPIIAALTALDALRAADIALTANIKFFFEGEEEIGSPHLAEYLRKYRQNRRRRMDHHGRSRPPEPPTPTRVRGSRNYRVRHHRLRRHPLPAQRTLRELGAESCHDVGTTSCEHEKWRRSRVDRRFL